MTTSAFEAQAPLDRTGAAPPARTLIDILTDVAARHPEASAIDDGSGALSYRELLARVWRTAAALHDAGVRRGDRVGVRMPSGSKELYVSILAVMAAGAAYVPVGADDPDERARLVFGEAGVRGIVAGEGEFVATEGDLVRLYDGDAPHPGTNAVPIVAANRIGREDNDGTRQSYYGHSFVADHRGDLVASFGDQDEGVLVHSFDLAEIARYRAHWGFFRDRRTDLYAKTIR